MKKSLIALAVASAIPALAQAQTSVTLTGILKTGLDAVSVKNAGTTGNMLALTDGSSRFIIAGSEDLGGGLRSTPASAPMRARAQPPRCRPLPTAPPG